MSRVLWRTVAVSVSVACVILSAGAAGAQNHERKGPAFSRPSGGAAPAAKPAAPAPAPSAPRPSFSAAPRSFSGPPPMMARPAPSFARPAEAPHFARPHFARPDVAARPRFTPGPDMAARRFARPSVAGRTFERSRDSYMARRAFGSRSVAGRSFRDRAALRSSFASRQMSRQNLRGSRLAAEQRSMRGRFGRNHRFADRAGTRGMSRAALRASAAGRVALRREALQKAEASKALNNRLATANASASARGLSAKNLAANTVAGRGGNRLAAAQTFHRRDWHQNWRRHRHAFSGWVGPLFWPYAYDDVFYDTVWGYGFDEPGDVYEDPFWSYGTADIYGGVFSPYGYDDMLAMGPPVVTGSAGGPAVGASSSRSGARSARLASPTRGDTGTTGTLPAPGWKQMCGEDSREVVGLPIERIRDIVQPDDAQRALLDDLGNASIQAAQTVKAACPSDYSLTPTGRLAGMEQRLRGMRQAVEVMRAPLAAFYGALSDEQKARLDAAGKAQAQTAEPATGEARKPRPIAQDCVAASSATEWPSDRIDRAIRPNETQRAALARLRDATTQAADTLAKACPSETPTTPPARLDAMAARLDAMIAAVTTVRTAVTDVYGTLSDEQKAAFNTLGQTLGTKAP